MTTFLTHLIISDNYCNVNIILERNLSKFFEHVACAWAYFTDAP